MLLAYAGPASNARIEYASQDCLRGGDALSEVKLMYEHLNETNFSNDNPQKVCDLIVISNIFNFLFAELTICVMAFPLIQPFMSDG